jgi:dGTPase
MKYTPNDKTRIRSLSKAPYRSPWRRDYARLIHSPSFRRLQGKTQLFPGIESDFFRNRLTHSLEVAQIAKSIALKLNHDLDISGEKYRIDLDLVEFAALAHDLGHPPFGHFGEQILDEKMINSGGFEGNAQTLRILAKLEKRELISGSKLGIAENGKDNRIGLNLSMRSLASILKYDQKIPSTSRLRAIFNKKRKKRSGELVKGYYHTEEEIVKELKRKVCGGVNTRGTFKTIECQIMDIADDIAYSTYDLEDSFKAGFIRPIDIISACEEVRRNVIKKVHASTGTTLTDDEFQNRIKNILQEIFKHPYKLDKPRKLDKRLLDFIHFYSIAYAYNRSNEHAEDGYFRTKFTSGLVDSAIRAVNIKSINKRAPALSTAELQLDKKIDVEILKNYVFESQILSPKIQMAALRSKEIIGIIFDILAGKNGHLLLPKDYRTLYDAVRSKKAKHRIICDFIAGMTDKYALEFYGRLRSENPQTIFKPL